MTELLLAAGTPAVLLAFLLGLGWMFRVDRGGKDGG